jgi:hypothetical protein
LCGYTNNYHKLKYLTHNDQNWLINSPQWNIEVVGKKFCALMPELEACMAMTSSKLSSVTTIIADDLLMIKYRCYYWCCWLNTTKWPLLEHLCACSEAKDERWRTWLTIVDIVNTMSWDTKSCTLWSILVKVETYCCCCKKTPMFKACRVEHAWRGK